MIELDKTHAAVSLDPNGNPEIDITQFESISGFSQKTTVKRGHWITKKVIEEKDTFVQTVVIRTDKIDKKVFIDFLPLADNDTSAPDTREADIRKLLGL